MDESGSAAPVAADPSLSSEEAAAKAAEKRFEGLMALRTKAVKGKGAWYWAHLEPILLTNADTGRPRAVKLRCCLCAAMFSASNPSRTASEHLKRGTCPHFLSPPPPTGAAPAAAVAPVSSSSPMPISSIAPFQHRRKRPVLSGGKQDLGALAMLEDSVKKLKSPRPSPRASLPVSQADAAVAVLSDWFLESAAVSSPLAAVDHPKFQYFLSAVGLPPLSSRHLLGPRLHSRFTIARADSTARLLDSPFFQLSCSGWAPSSPAAVSIVANLPNSTSVFHAASPIPPLVTSDFAEDFLLDAAGDISGDLRRCAGVVADRFKSTALRRLETRHPWMLNLSCLLRCFSRLTKDFDGQLPIFQSVLGKCRDLAGFFNTDTAARRLLHKYQLEELGHIHHLLRTSTVLPMLGDLLRSARPLRLAAADESFKLLPFSNPAAAVIAEVVHDASFWTHLEAVHALTKLVEDLIADVAVDRPLVGQCLPLWRSLRTKAEDWCRKYNIVDAAALQQILDGRFRKNYHPAWAAGFILDPLYLAKDDGGRYLPPFKCLTPEQAADVEKVVARLATEEEASAAALAELARWRAEGLDPLYAQAVQVRHMDPATGRMRPANPQGGQIVWESYLNEMPALGKVAKRIIFLHATAGGAIGCGSAVARWLEKAQGTAAGKLAVVAGHAKLQRKDFVSEADREAEVFTAAAAEEEEDDDDEDDDEEDAAASSG